ncbi:MAG: neutral/alkaline non-lysosomal ceramidase N-terminal domain-containing protein [Myxococcota bacterium]
MRSSARFALAVALALAAPVANAEELRVGLGVTSLPAKIGGPIGGFGGLTTRRAEGTLDPPQARALVLEQGELRVAIVALDIVIPRPNLRDALLEEIAPLEFDLVALVATHTHSGPGGYLPGFLAERVTGGEYDPKQPSRLARASARAIERALADLAPARIASGHAPLALARNRRFADGAIDDQLPVLRADFADGRAPIVVFAYGAHASLLSARADLYSADWPGAARAALEAKGWRSLYLPGPLGDQEPDVDLGFWPSVELERAKTAEYGAAIASAVLGVADGLAPQPDAALAALERWIEPPEVQLRRFCALWWTKPLVGETVDTFISKRVPIQVVRAGEAELLFLPAEPGASTGRELRAGAPAQRTRFVVDHANDWLGYVVDPQGYERGGYEACFSFFGPGMAQWLTTMAFETVGLLDARDAGAADSR